jgi:hypothetical protein
MPPVGFDPTTPAGERLQTDAVDRTTTRTGKVMGLMYQKVQENI